METQTDTEAWFRNPWVWLMISIPALTVLGCLLTIYIAIANPDYIVRDAQDSDIDSQVTEPISP